MHTDARALYKKYHDELSVLSRALRKKFYPMQKAGYLTTFGDIEGEMMYMLVREGQPETVFEISPNAGWSTNYILAALTKNKKGTLHSFDILTHMFGRPMEEVVRGNQSELCDLSRFQLHIGDARETVKTVPGDIQFLLIDSCHTDWFAKWFTSEVFPRVRGTIIVQDIAHWDRRESSSEATFMLDWLKRERIDAQLLGDLEKDVRSTDLRDGIAERRGFRSNSLIIRAPFTHADAAVTLKPGLDEALKEAASLIDTGHKGNADIILSRVMHVLVTDPTRVNRHRFLMKLCELYQRIGESDEANRCAQRAFGVVLGSDYQQRRKNMPELLILLLRRHQWQLFFQLKCVILLCPSSWGLMMRAKFRFLKNIILRK